MKAYNASLFYNSLFNLTHLQTGAGTFQRVVLCGSYVFRSKFVGVECLVDTDAFTYTYTYIYTHTMMLKRKSQIFIFFFFLGGGGEDFAL